MKTKVFSIVLGPEESEMLVKLQEQLKTNRNATIKILIRNAAADLNFKNVAKVKEVDIIQE